MTDEKYTKYGESENNNFRIIDSIVVPHPYCITPKHLEYSRSIYLDIEGAEKRSREEHPNDSRKWAVCDTCKRLYKLGKIPKILSWSEHQKAVLVECDAEIENNKELHQYLLKLKEQVTQDGYAGFAFVKSDKLKATN